MQQAVEIEVLKNCRTEQEAAILVALLEEAGIKARMGSALSSSFRVEAPGDVQVLVTSAELDRARHLLADLKKTYSTADEPEDEEPVKATHRITRRFWQIGLGLGLVVGILWLIVRAILNI